MEKYFCEVFVCLGEENSYLQPVHQNTRCRFESMEMALPPGIPVFLRVNAIVGTPSGPPRKAIQD